MEEDGSGPERDLCTIAVSYGTWPPREMVCGPSLCLLLHSSLSPACRHRSRWTHVRRLLFMSFLCLTCLCLHPQTLSWPESKSQSSGIFPKNFRPKDFYFIELLLHWKYPSSFHFPLLFKRQILPLEGWRVGGRGRNPAFCSLAHHSTQRQGHSNSVLCSKQERIMKGEWTDRTRGPKQKCQWKDSRWLCFAASRSQITRALDMKPIKPNPSPYL